MEIDTGASLSLALEQTYKYLWPEVPLVLDQTYKYLWPEVPLQNSSVKLMVHL